MPKKDKETSQDERRIILKLKKEGKSLSEISKIIGRPRPINQSIIKRFGSRKSLQNKPRCGHPSKIDGEITRFLIRDLKKNPQKSASALRKELEEVIGKVIFVSTVRTVLRKAGYQGRVA